MKDIRRFFRKKDHDTVACTINLVNLLGARVTKTTIRDRLQSDPEFPSLLSISSSLAEWKINTKAFKITHEKLQKLPVPFIVHLGRTRGVFIAVKKIDQHTATYLNSRGAEVNVSFLDFIDNWSGTVLLAELTAETGEAGYAKKRRTEILTGALMPTGVLLLLLAGLSHCLFITSSIGALSFAFTFLLNITGLLLTAFFLNDKLMNNGENIKAICKDVGNSDCNDVLNSSASQIFGISWLDIGFLYFIAALLLMLCNSPANNLGTPILWMNLLALPYVFFSVSYQAIAIKKWCGFCLTIQAIIVLIFITNWFTGTLKSSQFNNWASVNYITLILVFGQPTVFWFKLKHHLETAATGQIASYALLRIKRDPAIFEVLLKKQIRVHNDARHLGLTIGPSYAEHRLTKICDPYCTPCAKSFPLLLKLLDTGRWQVQIIFKVTPDIKNVRLLPVLHFLAIGHSDIDNKKLVSALTDWYMAPNKDYEAFAAKNPAKVSLEKFMPVVAEMNNWCTAERVDGTPTYFIDGYYLPDHYSINDL